VSVGVTQGAKAAAAASGTKTGSGGKIVNVVIGNEKALGKAFCNDLGRKRVAAVKAANPDLGLGRTLVHVLIDGAPVLLLAIADELRRSAPAFVRELKRNAIAPSLLTGDVAAVAGPVAGQCGISSVSASMTPDGKLAWVRDQKKAGHCVAMMGDGINDSPALKAADVGVAMGAGGTALAVTAADVVILNDSLGHVTGAIRLSKACRSIIIQNITLAVLLKLGVLGLALYGVAQLWMAVLVDVGSLLLVLANGTRLLGFDMNTVSPGSGDMPSAGETLALTGASPPMGYQAVAVQSEAAAVEAVVPQVAVEVQSDVAAGGCGGGKKKDNC